MILSTSSEIYASHVRIFNQIILEKVNISCSRVCLNEMEFFVFQYFNTMINYSLLNIVFSIVMPVVSFFSLRDFKEILLFAKI